VSDYQSTKNNPFLLPDTLYPRVIALIRDYHRLKDDYQEILHDGGRRYSTIQPRSGNKKSDETMHKAIRLSVVSDDLRAIDQALVLVPHEYRSGIKDNIIHRMRYPDDADISTYKRWKQKFIYNVAVNKGYI